MSKDVAGIRGFAAVDLTRRGGKFVANWRVFRPVVDLEKCVACGLCISYCPEEAIKRGEGGKASIDYRFCKGCGICANECPSKAIEMVRERE